MTTLGRLANKIIALAKAGERNPDALCERALQDIREQHRGPADGPQKFFQARWPGEAN